MKEMKKGIYFKVFLIFPQKQVQFWLSNVYIAPPSSRIFFNAWYAFKLGILKVIRLTFNFLFGTITLLL
jgi:hypothetical protein